MAKMELLFIAAMAVAIATTQGAPEAERVVSVPGFEGTLGSQHYAGYVTVDAAHGKHLFFYFVTSERDPSSDPLVLWLNGGPGCSSFDGFVYEHGPFKFQHGLHEKPQLSKNPYTWAKVANIIYLDSPVGVGLSYSDTTNDYITGDIQTSKDSHIFLLKWFEKYPEFISNPLYISGESYAGIYVPTLTQQIVNGLEGGVKPTLNLKGYIIGNGCTDEEFDGNAIVPFAYGMGLISVDLYKETYEACNASYWNPSTKDCEDKLAKIDQELYNLNIYDILEPCYHNTIIQSKQEVLPQSFRILGETHGPWPIRRRMFGRGWPLSSPVRKGYIPSWHQLTGRHHQRCLNDHIANIWLNDPMVREALHAKPVETIGNWVICSHKVSYYSDAGSMIPLHYNLTRKGFRALIYSGDHDMCVPYTGSESWTRSMGYNVVDEWRPWFVDEQVAGYVRGYDKGLTFATVKGSGHTVPEYKPIEALGMFQRWLQGNPL